jgi:hypothetical protein
MTEKIEIQELKKKLEECYKENRILKARLKENND